MKEQKRVISVVTGGAGFLGSHLCDKLIELGHKVICLDNLLTGSMQNISHLQNNPHFLFIKHDVSNHITIDDEVNYVFHFASPVLLFLLLESMLIQLFCSININKM